jgi:hypothetical protein
MPHRSARTIVPNPIVSHDFEVLYGVSAGSTNDVWAVGVRGGDVLSLIEHWDGSQWSVVPSPTGRLSAVTALSKVDAWAVGFTTDTESQTLTEHWNGVSWSIV